MPHKHVRARDNDKSTYNLPPTSIAKPLPVGKHGQSVFTTTDDESNRRAKAKAKRRRDARNTDDTPKAFARLMQWQAGKKPANGLDNGEARSSKKRKRTEAAATGNAAAAVAAKAAAEKNTKTQQQAARPDMPKIQPGERLADFAARVDQALPVSGLTRKGKSDLGPKDRQTKTELRLQKMYAEWRKEDARLKEKRDEAQEVAEDEEDEDDEEEEGGYGGVKKVEVPTVGKKKRKRMVGEEKEKEDDPWAELKLKRDEPRGLHDVAKAPPEFTVVPREKFKVKNGAIAQVADVPNASGSLKRREELGAARLSIIEQYRQMMNKGTAT